jgi:tyrosinase
MERNAMHSISRRALMGAGAFGAGLMSSPFFLRPAQAATLTRYDITTAKGQEMLKIYAGAVKTMMTTPEAETRGWMFQWYTHAVRGDRNKAGEITRVYGNNSSAPKSLAQAAWSTCEPHFNFSHVDYFLPWHRMYVLCLEQIVQAVAKRPDFSLPYWNYTDASQRAMPEQFRKKDDPTWGALYRPDRWPGANAGTPVDQVPPYKAPLNLDCMKLPNYPNGGFCSSLNNAPHGSLHVDVGNSQGMSVPQWAANDPVFWVHHSNIDRIWASWNKAGGKNPAMSGSYSFAGGDGKEVKLDVGKFMNADTSVHGYVYDTYLPRPPGSIAFPKANNLVAFALHAASPRSSGPITLGAAATTVTLASAAAAPAPNNIAPENANRLPAELKALPGNRQFVLRLENVTANAEPGISYDVYYGLAPGQQPSHESPAFVGTLSLFGVAKMADMPGMADAPGQTFSFVVTQPVQQALNGAANAASTVTLVPTGKPNESAAPTIGSISLQSA